MIHKKSVKEMCEEFDRKMENLENPKEPEIKSKCELCKITLEAHRESSMPNNPVFGQTYSSYVDYYYCPNCKLMYSPMVEE